MTEARSLIPPLSALETDFPATMLSEVGTKESWRKEIHRPATSTHKWWAKRLGSVFRGIIAAAFTPVGEDAAAAYASGLDLRGAVVFDPFAGSGVTAVETRKASGRPVCFDINPVATLVQRQALADWDMGAIERAYADVERRVRSEIDRVHLTEDGETVLYYFWVATTSCPVCERTVRLFDSPVYSKNAYPGRVPKAEVVCPQCLDVQTSRFDFEHLVCSNGHDITQRCAVQGARTVCGCGHVFKALNSLRGRRPGYEMYAKMVLGYDGAKFYRPVTSWDRDLYSECQVLVSNLPDSAVLPAGSLSPGINTKQALNWNFRSWRDFFNDRQLYSLSLIGTAVRDLDAPPLAREALSALFSGTLEFNNMFASFKGEGTGAVRHMFSHHILKPERTPLEAHPWGTPQSSGSFSTLFSSRLVRAHDYKCRPADLVSSGCEVARTFALSKPLGQRLVTTWRDFAASDAAAYVATGNSADSDMPDACVDVVVTDPPFMDNVHYAELADFFHAWLRTLKPFEGYPSDDTTRRVGEVQNADPQEFGKAIEAVWAECERVLKPGGLLAFTFHQARMEGWLEVVKALTRVGFVVTAVQPVKSEMSTSIVKAGAREPSNLDSVVVCRRVRDGAVGPFASREDAYERAVELLRGLLQFGVSVGAGDIRSVVRGTVLAQLAASGENLDGEVDAVDALANGAVAALLARRMH